VTYLDKKIVIIISILILSVSFVGIYWLLSNEAVLPYKILVVQSYHEGLDWERDVERGIIEGLYRSGYIEGQDYEIKTFHMNTKVKYTAQDEIEQRADEVFDLIVEFKPNIVFINNDNALQYVANKYTQNHPDEKLPFVFAGVNLDPTIYDSIVSLETPGGSITGALERIPYYEAFSLGKRIFTNSSKIMILADSSPSSTFIVSSFQERYLDKVTDSPLQVVDFIQVGTFDEWKEKVGEYQTKVDILGILNYHQLRNEDGQVVPISDIVNWTVNNNMLPELGLIPTYAKEGILSAVGISYYRTGIYVGIIGGEILGGADPATIAIIDPNVIEITYNLERAEMLGIEIPFMELMEATEVYHNIPES